MSTKLAEITLWQRNLASMIRSGLMDRAEIVEAQNLFVVIGIHHDGSPSAPLAKYGDRRRAEDALNLVRNLIDSRLSIEAN